MIENSDNDSISSVKQENNKRNMETTHHRKKKKLPSVFKTMALGIISLVGENIHVELRNNQNIYGTLEECDSNMNLILSHTIINEKQLKSDMLHINGTTIRYVHVDDGVNVLGHVVKYAKNYERMNNKSFKIYDRKRSNITSSNESVAGFKRKSDDMQNYVNDENNSLEMLEQSEFVIELKKRDNCNHNV